MANQAIKTKPGKTATAQDAANVVRPLVQGVFADGITLTVADRKVYPIHGYWQVPLVPSHWPDRTLPIHEDLVRIESRLQDQGINDIILALGESL